MNKAVIRSIAAVVVTSMIGYCSISSERLEKVFAAEPAISPPPKAPTDDPLYQAIIGELRGARQSLEVGTEEKAKEENPTAESDRDTGMTRDDWLAVESMLKAARLLEKKALDTREASSNEYRVKLASLLRNQVTEFIKSRP